VYFFFNYSLKKKRLLKELFPLNSNKKRENFIYKKSNSENKIQILFILSIYLFIKKENYTRESKIKKRKKWKAALKKKKLKNKIRYFLVNQN
jgi:hypothetical protein